MGKACLITLVVILPLLISDGDCWGSRRRRLQPFGGGQWRPSIGRVKSPLYIGHTSNGYGNSWNKGSFGRWSQDIGRIKSPLKTGPSLNVNLNAGRSGLSSVGATYNFRNGHSLTAYKNFKNGGGFGLSYKFKFGRKRRSVEQEKLDAIERDSTGIPKSLNPKLLFFKHEKQAEGDKVEASDDSSPPENGMKQDTDDCSQCLEIKPFNASDQNVENKTLAGNDFVMVVKLIEENLSALKLDTKIKFEVIDVVKSPTDSITSGQTFTIKAQMATCPCIATLDPGFYVVTGQTNDESQLVLSNVLMEFEN